MWAKLLPLLLIYIASWCYVIASYYHLHLKNWSFLLAFLIAVPFVLIEYIFSLNGNKLANASITPLQIVLVTISFYIINILILNLLVLKAPINIYRDGLAVILIFGAIFLSTNTRL